MSAKVADVLDKAAEVIETRGWWQGNFGNDITNPTGCKVCARGAINVAVNGSPWSTKYTFLPGSALSRQIGRLAIEIWNDHPSRTKAEVITALRNAAAAERAS